MSLTPYSILGLKVQIDDQETGAPQTNKKSSSFKAPAAKVPIKHVDVSKLNPGVLKQVEAVTGFLVSVVGIERDQLLFCDSKSSYAVYSEPKMEPGRLVLACPSHDDPDDEFHPATIYEIDRAGCWVDFGDGSDLQLKLWSQVAAPSSSRELPQPKIGTRIVCEWGENVWYSGRVRKLHKGGSITVKWDDGSDTTEFKTEHCAFFLADGLVADRANIFINLPALTTEAAHGYFGGCVEDGAAGCVCVFRMLADNTRRTLGLCYGELHDHRFHFRLLQHAEKASHFRNNVDREQNRVEVHIKGIQLQRISDTKHPCHGELGVFANGTFDVGHEFGIYAGKVMHEDKIDTESASSKYHMKFGFDDEFVIDARTTGNELRYVNDFRSVTKRANCQFQNTSNPLTGENTVILKASAQIFPGDELLVDYGDDYWKQRGNKSPCRRRKKRERGPRREQCNKTPKV